MTANGFGEVRHEHGRRIHDGVARGLGGFAFHVGDPGCGQLEHRLDGGDALEGDFAVGRVHGQPAARHELALANGLAFEQEPILVRPQLEIVAKADRRNQHAHVLGEIAANARDPFEQVPALVGIGERDKTIAQLNLEGVEREQVLQLIGRFGFRGGRGAGSARPGGARFGAGLASRGECGRRGEIPETVPVHAVGQHSHNHGQREERHHGQARDERQDGHHPGHRVGARG